jgi:hypothetical protein
VANCSPSLTGTSVRMRGAYPREPGSLSLSAHRSEGGTRCYSLDGGQLPYADSAKTWIPIGSLDQILC